jgi:hypothetical protein
MKLGRRSHGASLGRRQRRKVDVQTRTLVKQLQHGTSGSDDATTSHHAVSSMTQLRRTLHGARQDILKDGSGPHTKLVAGALGDIDHTLATLAQSYRADDPNERLRLLAAASQSLARAEAKARKAGHDWPL